MITVIKASTAGNIFFNIQIFSYLLFFMKIVVVRGMNGADRGKRQTNSFFIFAPDFLKVNI
jgi:hypothetical protein